MEGGFLYCVQILDPLDGQVNRRMGHQINRVGFIQNGNKDSDVDFFIARVNQSDCLGGQRIGMFIASKTS